MNCIIFENLKKIILLCTAMILIFNISCNPFFIDNNDRDGDGLSDGIEKKGWDVTIEDGLRKMTTYRTKSRINLVDTDGDGLTDLQEYILKSDPTIDDTDGDGLLDSREAIYGANILDVDTDNDALAIGQNTPNPNLFDYNEAIIHGSSPLLKDTDGDGRDDLDEISGGSFNPLIAEVPRVQIVAMNNPRIAVIQKESQGSSNTISTNVGTLERKVNEYSQSDTTTTRVTNESWTSADIGVEAGVTLVSGCPVPLPVLNVDTKVVSGSKTQFFNENTSSFEQNSTQSLQQEYTSRSNEMNSENTLYIGGTITIAYKIQNLSNIGIKINKLIISILKKQKRNQILPITTLKVVSSGDSDALYSELTIPANGETGILTMTGELDLQTTRNLMSDPSSLMTEVANYGLVKIDSNGNEVLDYTGISTLIKERTATIIIDYGGGRSPDIYNVRTTLLRNGIGSQAGTPLRDIMDILKKDEGIGLHFETLETNIYDANGVVVDNVKKLISINGIDSVSIDGGFWTVFSSNKSIQNPELNFDEIVVNNGDFVSISFSKDSDRDNLSDREEIVRGSDIHSSDTDGDGLDDFDEARVGWDISVIGDATRHIYSDPRNDDFDGDTLTDSQEKQEGTDPYLEDTDKDTVNDNFDSYPLDPDNA